MKASGLKKDHNTSVRANSELLSELKAQGLTLQQFLDMSLDKHFGEFSVVDFIEKGNFNKIKDIRLI